MSAPASKFPPILKRLGRGLWVAGFAFTLGAWLAGYLGGWHWLLDLFDHFRFQYGTAFAVLLLGFLVQRRWRFAALSALSLLVACFPLLPYYLPHRTTGTNSTLTLLSFNVHTANPQKGRVVELIGESDADVVALYEVDDRWVRALRALESRYPFSLYAPRPDNFGIALISRVSFEEAHVFQPGPAELPSIWASIAGPKGTFVFVCTHPVPPMGAWGTRLRNGQIAELGRFVSGLGRRDVVVAGDLNAAPWTRAVRPLFRAGLRDARLGHGLSPTWRQSRPWIALPIDHVLVGPDIEAVNVEILDATGSDHHPVRAVLRNRR